MSITDTSLRRRRSSPWLVAVVRRRRSSPSFVAVVRRRRSSPSFVAVVPGAILVAEQPILRQERDPIERTPNVSHPTLTLAT
jgi:hypothetical protein